MRWLALPALLVAIFLSQQASAASYDCTKAAAPDERAVCADPRLSKLDDRLAAAYAQAKAGAANGRESAEVVRKARHFQAVRKDCGADASCIEGRYVEVLDLLAQASQEPGEEAQTPPDHASPSVCVVILGLQRQATTASQASGDAEDLRSAMAAYREKSIDLHDGSEEEAQQMIGSTVNFYNRLAPEELESAADMCLAAVDEDFDEDE